MTKLAILKHNLHMLSDKKIKELIKEKNISTIHLQFADINGSIKTLSMPSKHIDEILNNEIMFDGSSINGFRENETLDLKLCPDKGTFLVYPENITKLKNSARFICDIHNSDGSPFEGCLRSNLKRVIKNANDYGYTMEIGPEVEFFLFKKDKCCQLSNVNPEKAGYYDVNQAVKYDETLNIILTLLQEAGYEVDALHHEGAPFQHEIDLGYSDILKAADDFVTLKYLTKTIADTLGYKVTFMPKPVYGQNGSGLHLNISLSQNGSNAFYDENKQYMLSDIAKYSIGALLKNIKGITAILNPTINSYKRLVKDYEAPIYIVWSIVTRSALVRIPAKRGSSTRLELRSPDASMNPYLAFAVLLQTCIDGIRNKVDPPMPVEKNLFLLSSNEIKQRKIKSLPRNLFTAIEELEKSYVARAALGEYIFNQFIENKKKEWNDYRKQVTPWELSKYLDI